MIRFAPEYENGLRERGIDLETLEDGSVRARIPYVDRRWLVREVLRYGGGAVLEEPRDLRAEVAGTAAALRRAVRRRSRPYVSQMRPPSREEDP